MNNNRLSTSNKPRVDRTLLYTEIDKLLNGTSNYEIKEGKKYIKSLGRYVRYEISIKALGVQLVDSESGNIIQTFNSFYDCSKFLGISRPTVSNRSLKGICFLYKGKSVYLKRVLSE